MYIFFKIGRKNEENLIWFLTLMLAKDIVFQLQTQFKISEEN